MTRDESPVLSIIGKKNSGKTTFLVALAAELKRRGYRVASIKHGHHHFEIDKPGTDSWRHFHEGETEATLMVGGDRIALVMRSSTGEPDPRDLIAHFYAGRRYDVVLVEGYKHGPFPKLEIFRRAQHEQPVYEPGADEFLAVVTDDASFRAGCAVIPLDGEDARGSHVRAAADLIEGGFLGGGAGAT